MWALVLICACTKYGEVLTEALSKAPNGSACPAAPPLNWNENDAETVAVTPICSLLAPDVIKVAYGKVSATAPPEASLL